jgi:hypothetical protein
LALLGAWVESLVLGGRGGSASTPLARRRDILAFGHMVIADSHNAYANHRPPEHTDRKTDIVE